VSEPWWAPRSRRSQRADRGGSTIGRDQTAIHDASQRLDNRLYQNINASTGHSLQEIADFARAEASKVTEEYEGRLQAALGDYDAASQEIERLRARPRVSPKVLAVAAFASLLLGGWIGANTSDGDKSQSRTGATDAASSNAVRTPSALPKIDSSDSGQVPTLSYTRMPCAPGSAVVFLAAVQGPKSDEFASYVASIEQRRAKYVLKDQHVEVHASTAEQLCPIIRAGSYGEAANATYRFLWVGPLASKPAAAAMCDKLKKPSRWDCLPQRVDSPE
jgi:hypothetical protein